MYFSQVIKIINIIYLCQGGFGRLDSGLALIVHSGVDNDGFPWHVAAPVQGNSTQDQP